MYETLNLAALYKLPLLVIIENNSLSISSRLKDRRSTKYDVEKIVTGLGARYSKANGNDYLDVHEKVADALKDIRKVTGPAVVECMVYRHMAHSTPLMDEKTREEDTLENRLVHDSVKRLRQHILEKGIANEEALTEIEKNNNQSVAEAIAFAIQTPYPTKDKLYTDMYAE